MKTAGTAHHIRWFEDLDRNDVAEVGGKNASLGEMVRALQGAGIRVPGGFATTADAYRTFLAEHDLEDPIGELVRSWQEDGAPLEETAARIREHFRKAPMPETLAAEITAAYHELGRRGGTAEPAVAVRSSATAEDLPEASFAGQQESYLNVRGADRVVAACRDCMASLFTARAMAYRREHGFDHRKVALSVGVQKMVRADLAGAGVMFSIDTETGFPRVVVINAAWGLGENVVQGTVDPDEHRVFRPLLDREDLVPIVGRKIGGKQQKMVYLEEGAHHTTHNVETTGEERRRAVLNDDRILTLARWAVRIEEHYGVAMDMEWALDGDDGGLYLVQARPETVQSRRRGSAFVTYELVQHPEPRLEGLAIGDAIAQGPVRRVTSLDDAEDFVAGEVLVAGTTNPGWVPIMRRAAAIVTDHGGRTSHAAIVSRELGIPAVVGTQRAMEVLGDGEVVTVSCAEGETGRVYEGRVPFERREVDLEDLPEPPVRVMMNIATPDAAYRWWRLPARGIGLARLEFVIGHVIGIHPLALTRFDRLTDPDVRRAIEERTQGYADRTEFFVDEMARAVAAIAASQHPEPVVVRLSDFKTNEYAGLLGGRTFEPHEENPMLGFRGAARYPSDAYRDGFALECRALVRARERIGLDNIVVMVPFVRTLEEADRVLATMADHGLRRGDEGLQVYMMCEVPSNVFLAEEFAERFDGFSIGSNDLTQLILGIDRDSTELAAEFDERNEAVLRAIRHVIDHAHRRGCTVGICGQAPSDHPDFARFLVDAGIDSISLNPDCVIETVRRLGGG